MVKVPNTQGLQIDYWDVDSADVKSIDGKDFNNCPIYGGTQFAFQICIAPSSLNVDHLIVGMALNISFIDSKAWWACPFYNIGQHGQCLIDKSWFEESPEKSITAMRVRRHTFDAIYSRRNSSILSVSNVRLMNLLLSTKVLVYFFFKLRAT